MKKLIRLLVTLLAFSFSSVVHPGPTSQLLPASSAAESESDAAGRRGDVLDAVERSTSSGALRLAFADSILVAAADTASTATALSVSPTSVARGDTVTVTWSDIASPSAWNWIGLYRGGAADSNYLSWIYVSCSQTADAPRASGSCPFAIPSGTASGTYELRLFGSGPTLLATSEPLTVASASSPSSTTLSVSPTNVAPGDTVTATWSDIASPTAWNWIGLYRGGAADSNYLSWIYVSCSQTADVPRESGSCPLAIPSGSASGLYELRLFGSGRTRLATSEPFSVATGTIVTRGPYLQMGTSQSITVRWRTNVATNSRVRYGTAPNDLPWAADNLNLTTEHEVTLSGLLPDGTYYYSIGTTTATLAGGDATHYFVTAPMTGTAKQTRIWVLGDSGTADANARAVRDAYLNFTGQTRTDLVLMLGDNAYDDGTDAEYQRAVFDMYPMVLRNTVLWPTIGNHDTAGSTVPGIYPYHEIFSLPTNAEAGGMPSGTENYYSFDYGNIHFISLDSMTSDRSANGPMMTWLRSNLASTTQPWIIAFWHHPPYSKGSHDSDTEIELIEMRENALPILEEAGVDLVLAGHSHSYERSFLISGHYGHSTTFNQSMIKDGGSGRADTADGAYERPPGPHEGSVYVVAGSSGYLRTAPLNHPVMYISHVRLGSLVLDIDGNRLDAKFLDSAGVVRDYFTIIKGSPPSPPAAPSDLAATAVSTSQIDLSWVDNSTDEERFDIERWTGDPPSTTIVSVGPNVTAYSATGLAAGTTYSFRVRAANRGGESAPSNTASATTQSSPPPLQPPNAPSGLTATAISGTQINLSWSDNSANEDGFRIERCQGSNCSNFVQIAQLGANATSYSNTGLSASTHYRYRVRAFNSAGNSAYSNIAGSDTLAPPLQLPNAPSELTASAVSSTQINLTWADNSGNEDGFHIERCQGPNCSNFAQITQVGANVTSYANSGLSGNTHYSYRVRAFNAQGSSAYSNIAGARTPNR
jgi:acid phosphatase type 7